jgi:hypothetical protein
MPAKPKNNKVKPEAKAKAEAKKPAKKKLKPQHQIVVNEIAKGKTQTEAYQKAYPNVTPEVARVNASRLLTNANISEAVQNRINRALKHSQVTPEEVIGHAAFNMRTSFDDLIDENGFFDLKKSRETGAIDVIKEMEIVETIDLETKAKTVKHKVKIDSPAAARKEVANYIGLEKAPVQSPQSLTDEDLARELFRRLIEKRGWNEKDALEGIKQRFPDVDVNLLTA